MAMEIISLEFAINEQEPQTLASFTAWCRSVISVTSNVYLVTETQAFITDNNTFKDSLPIFLN